MYSYRAVKCLGVTFDKSGTADEDITSRINNARKALSCLNGIF